MAPITGVPGPWDLRQHAGLWDVGLLHSQRPTNTSSPLGVSVTSKHITLGDHSASSCWCFLPRMSLPSDTPTLLPPLQVGPLSHLHASGQYPPPFRSLLWQSRLEIKITDHFWQSTLKHFCCFQGRVRSSRLTSHVQLWQLIRKNFLLSLITCSVGSHHFHPTPFKQNAKAIQQLKLWWIFRKSAKWTPWVFSFKNFRLS